MRGISDPLHILTSTNASKGHDPTLPRLISGKIWTCQYKYCICSGFGNFWIRRGECPLYRMKFMNIQIYHYLVVFQLSIMIGYIFQPTKFPIMPCMKRTWHPAMATDIDQIPDEIPLPAPATKKSLGRSIN